MIFWGGGGSSKGEGDREIVTELGSTTGLRGSTSNKGGSGISDLGLCVHVAMAETRIQ